MVHALLKSSSLVRDTYFTRWAAEAARLPSKLFCRSKVFCPSQLSRSRYFHVLLKGDAMRFIVRIPELDCSIYEGDGGETNQELFRLIQKLEKSGNLVEGGLLADDRGGFLLMEAGSFSEMESLLDSIFDPSRFKVESHPILPFKELADLMNKMKRPVKPAGKSPVNRKTKTRRISQTVVA